MKTTTESLIEQLRNVFEGHNKNTFGNAVNLLTSSFPEYFDSSSSKPEKMFFVPFETAFRLHLEKEIVDALNLSLSTLRESIERLIDLAFWCFQQDYGKETLPFVLMEDIYDLLTINQCEEIFDVFEKRSDSIRLCTRSNAGKGRFLRSNNTMLTRLSKSVNIKLKGRILLFLAVNIPVDDKSGLNLKGDSNIGNVTEIEAELPDNMDLSDDHEIPIDYNFYRTFWSLQNYFVTPSTIWGSDDSFSKFVDTATTVIDSFENSEIHYQQYIPNNTDIKTTDDLMDVDKLAVEDDSTSFLKYLTSTRLFHLQMKEPHFQRCVLVQFEILFHLIEGNKKDKLTESNLKSIENLKIRVNSTLKKPIFGSEFYSVIRNALQNEDYWVEWKKDGCNKFDVSAPIEIKNIEESKKELEPYGKDLGTSTLTELWNISEDNYDILEKSEIIPTVKDFVAERLLDEPDDIEESDKLKNDPLFLWKSSRLIARQQLGLFSKMKYQISQIELLKSHFNDSMEEGE